MLKQTAIAIALLGLLQSGTVLAKEKNEFKISSTYTKCANSIASQSTQGMKECIASEEKRQMTRLNKAYSKAIKELPAERKQGLEASQTAWLKYRQTYCSFLFSQDGGTLAGVEAGMCYMNKAAQRATELENIDQR